MKRDKALHILVTTEEHEMLRRIAEAEGLTSADYVRQHIRKTHGALFGEQVLAAPRGLKKAPKRTK